MWAKESRPRARRLPGWCVLCRAGIFPVIMHVRPRCNGDRHGDHLSAGVRPIVVIFTELCARYFPPAPSDLCSFAGDDDAEVQHTGHRREPQHLPQGHPTAAPGIGKARERWWWWRRRRRGGPQLGQPQVAAGALVGRGAQRRGPRAAGPEPHGWSAHARQGYEQRRRVARRGR